MGAEYPAHLEVDVVLRDGSTAHLRPVRTGDEGALLDLFEGLDTQSTSFRFFSGAPDLTKAAKLLSDVDYEGRHGLVASRGERGRLVGHGTYMETGPGRGEVAFAIAEEMQGQGLGTLLLAHLAETARDNGIEVLTAEVLPQNHRMVEVFRESGLPVETRSLPGTLLLELPTSFSAEAVQRFEDRDRLAAQAAVRRFLRPQAIAVVGASRRRGTVGGEAFHNLLESGFEGPVLPVNQVSDVVQSVRAYHRIAELPDPVDLAVVAAPAEDVPGVARECAAAGVPAMVVLSAGFAEAGEAGARRQREPRRLPGRGMRLIGPNCLGILNTDPEARLNATFAAQAPSPGNVGFVTQSGALGIALIDLAAHHGLGGSSFASIGNRADITANDFLDTGRATRNGGGPALHRVVQRPTALLAPCAPDRPRRCRSSR